MNSWSAPMLRNPRLDRRTRTCGEQEVPAHLEVVDKLKFASSPSAPWRTRRIRVLF